MPIIIPFLVGVARVAGPAAVKLIAARLRKGVAIKTAQRVRGFRKQPKVETIRGAKQRQALERTREVSKESVRRQLRMQAEQDKASRELVARVARENKQFEAGLKKTLGDLVQNLQKDQLRNSILTGKGPKTTKAVRDFNKAATREILKIITKPKPPKGPRGPRGT